MMTNRTWNCLVGLALALGTTNLQPAADLMLVVLYARMYPGRWHWWTAIPYPLLGLFGILLAVSLTTHSPWGGFHMILRVWVVWLILSLIISRQSYTKIEFWLPFMFVLCAQLAFGLLQLIQFNWNTPLGTWRIPHAFNANSAQLGLGAASLTLSPAGPLSLLLLGLSQARSYFLATTLTILVFWRTRTGLALWFLLAALPLIIFSFARITPDGLALSATDRASLNSPDVIPTITGLGVNNFVLTGIEPPPHNIGFLTKYELGWFSYPFWGIISFSLFRYRLWHLAIFLIAGVASTELWTEAEGTYALVLVHISWLWLKSGYRGITKSGELTPIPHQKGRSAWFRL